MVCARRIVAYRAVLICGVVLVFAVPNMRAALESCTYNGGGARGKATVIDSGNSVVSVGLGVYAAKPGDPWVVAVKAAWNIFRPTYPYRPATIARTSERHL